jgi:hypothetical protein
MQELFKNYPNHEGIDVNPWTGSTWSSNLGDPEQRVVARIKRDPAVRP